MSQGNFKDYLDDYRVLVVPGLHGSGSGHWQTRWESLHPRFERVEQADWDTPDLDVWSARLAQVLSESDRPALLVAHSFGCLASVHRMAADAANAANVAGALLVAPADPQKFRVAARMHPLRLKVPSIMIGSTNDPWMPGNRAAYWSACWGSEFFNAGPIGHINAESDLGDWRFGLFCLQQLVLQVRARQRAFRRAAQPRPVFSI